MLSLTVIVLVATLFFVASYYAGAFYKAWGPLIFGLGFLFFVVSGMLDPSIRVGSFFFAVLAAIAMGKSLQDRSTQNRPL
jgi:hypothetical protein